jgi:hypothetical protein
VRRDAPQFDVTQDQLEQALKAKGLIDETDKERIAKTERDGRTTSLVGSKSPSALLGASWAATIN